MGIRRALGRIKLTFDFQSEFRRGQAALDEGDYDDAVRIFEALAAQHEEWAPTWFNLGLAQKFRRDWRASMVANRRAAELDPEDEPSFWNCGVAATAIRDWATARWAWRGIKLDPGEGDGPPAMQLGPAPVRLDPDDVGEVVWGTRIDPCRVRIDNVPLPESGHRWRDVILHDVVPHGSREAWGRTWIVFDELVRMDPSDEPTWEAEVAVPTDDDWNEVHQRFTDVGLGIEDWSTIRILCKTCSESEPHAHERPDDLTPIRLVVRRFGFAGSRETLETALKGWVEAGQDRAYRRLFEAEVAGGRTSDA